MYEDKFGGILCVLCAMEVCHYSVCACMHVCCGLSVALDYSMLLNLAYGEFSKNRCSLCWSVVILFIYLFLLLCYCWEITYIFFLFSWLLY